MKNIVDEIAVLKRAIDLEETLREATSVEWAQGLTGGPMQKSHEVAILGLLKAAKALVEKAES
jgi:hypothetical protein